MMSQTWRCRYLSLRLWFHLFWINTQKWDLWIIWQFYFNFFKNLHTIPLWLYQFTFPPTVHKRFLSPTSVISCPFDQSHCSRCEVISPCGLWFAFPWWLVMLRMYLVAICISSSEKNYLFRSFSHFKIRLFDFSAILIKWVLYKFWILTLYKTTYLQMHFLIALIAFSSCWQFLLFGVVPAVHLCLCCFCFCCHTQKIILAKNNLAKIICQE